MMHYQLPYLYVGILHGATFAATFEARTSHGSSPGSGPIYQICKRNNMLFFFSEVTTQILFFCSNPTSTCWEEVVFSVENNHTSSPFFSSSSIMRAKRTTLRRPPEVPRTSYQRPGGSVPPSPATSMSKEVARTKLWGTWNPHLMTTTYPSLTTNFKSNWFSNCGIQGW